MHDRNLTALIECLAWMIMEIQCYKCVFADHDISFMHTSVQPKYSTLYNISMCTKLSIIYNSGLVLPPYGNSQLTARVNLQMVANLERKCIKQAGIGEQAPEHVCSQANKGTS